MDQLVAVGDIEVPARLRARVRRVVTHQPGDPLEPLIADLRTHLPPRVHVLGADQDAADLAELARIGRALREEIAAKFLHRESHTHEET